MAGPGADTYVVVLRHVVVAQDIAQTILEHDPVARVVEARSAEEALARLADAARVAVAFVGKGPDEFRASPLAAALAQRGARVILLGEEAELHGAAQGFDVLERPFTIDNVMARLRPARADEDEPA